MGVSRQRLSKDGPIFSRLVHGLWRLAYWQLTRQQSSELISRCFELGITTFDHADIYGKYTCEELFGQAFAASGVARDKVQFVTKCGIKLVAPNRGNHQIKHYDTSRDHIIQSVEQSLANLRTDYIDLLLIHRPDPLMDADEVAGAFSELRKAGKVLHFGVSNFEVGQFELLASRVERPLVTNQIEHSVMNMEAQSNGVLDMCQRLRICPLAWSPLGGGRLFTEETEQTKRLAEALKSVGHELGGVAMDQVALAWILRHPSKMLPILGTGKIRRIEQAVACERLSLSREQWFRIWGASTGTDVP